MTKDYDTLANMVIHSHRSQALWDWVWDANDMDTTVVALVKHAINDVIEDGSELKSSEVY